MKTGKIYKIVHSQSDIVYVGSTFNTLRDRLSKHKNIDSKCIIKKYIQEFGSDQFKIILIKEYEVVDRKHLEAYEQLWINRTKCINNNSAFAIAKLTRKLWCVNNKDAIKKIKATFRKNNKDKIKEYRENNKDKIKEYRENNKDKMKEYQREYRNKKKIVNLHS
jgi:hypothetical protein